jgi:hypothetical protein
MILDKWTVYSSFLFVFILIVIIDIITTGG